MLFSGGGLPRKLECHGFVCKSQDDAISVAAQLYQGLLDAIRRHGSKVRKENTSWYIITNLIIKFNKI